MSLRELITLRNWTDLIFVEKTAVFVSQKESFFSQSFYLDFERSRSLFTSPASKYKLQYSLTWNRVHLGFVNQNSIISDKADVTFH